MSSALADDNGAYSAAGGKARYLFHVTFKGDGLVDTTKTVQYNENGSLYYNTRVTGKQGKTSYVKTYVDDGSVYELTRIYRKNKANPELVHMIVTVRKKKNKDSEKYYVTSYRVSSTESQENFEENFKVPKHGNALKPTAASYCRTDKKVLEQAAASLTENKSCAAVYENLALSSLSSVSSELCNPKQVQNINQASQDLASQGNSTQSSSNDEMTRIVSQMRSTNSSELFTRLVTILPEHYFSVHFTDESIQDVERFCVMEILYFVLIQLLKLSITSGSLTQATPMSLSFLN